MRMPKRASLCAVVALAIVCAGSSARALPPEEKDWEVQATFYGWAASIDAEVEAGDVSRDLEVEFQDLLGDLGWAVMGNVEARWKRALVVVDTFGMQVVSDISRSPRTVPFAGPDGNVTGDLTNRRLRALLIPIRNVHRELHPSPPLLPAADAAFSRLA